MPDRNLIWNRSRLRFALIGAVACLIAGLCAEAIFAILDSGKSLRESHTPSLLFVTVPDTTVVSRTPPQPPNDGEMQRRLQNMGAATGDVQISLAWNGRNDLDLSCQEPSGETIDGYNQQSRAGGQLDVDMNPTDDGLISPFSRAKLIARTGRLSSDHRTGTSSTPVENIVWKGVQAPAGHYRVFVHQFCNKEGSVSTPFWIEVKMRGIVKRINGAVGKEDFAKEAIDPQLAIEFDVPPVIIGAVPMSARRDSSAVEAQNYALTAFSLTQLWRSLLVSAVWGGLIGMILPLSLKIGQAYYRREKQETFASGLSTAFFGFSTGLFTVISGQFVMAIALTAISYAAYSSCHVAGWLLFGSLFGAAAGGLVPNLPKIPAIFASVFAAALSSALCQTMYRAEGGTIARVLSAAIWGGCLGILILVQESVEELTVEEPHLHFSLQEKSPYQGRSSRSRSVGGLGTRKSDRREDR